MIRTAVFDENAGALKRTSSGGGEIATSTPRTHHATSHVPHLARVLWRLRVMYLVQNLVWGAQMVLLSGHMDRLGFSGEQISYVFATGALAAILSPLVVGWIADRFLPAQLIAGCNYLLCAPVLIYCWRQTAFGPLWWGMLAFHIIHVPTMALTNAIAFRHLGDLHRFGRIRVWGSLGWIAVSWFLSLYLRFFEHRDPDVSHLGDGLLVAGILAVAMGLYCFRLPHTPPSRQVRTAYAFLEAFRLLGRRGFSLLLGATFVVALTRPLLGNFLFIFLVDDVDGPGMSPSTVNWAMSLGQVMEIPIMLALGAATRRLGMRLVLFLGLLAQVAHAGAMAWGRPAWFMVAVQAVNGLFITFFAIASSVAVERLAPAHLRASAQGLLAFIFAGVGALAGQLICGRVYDSLTLGDGHHLWGAVFLVPALAAALAAIMLLLFGDETPSADAGG